MEKSVLAISTLLLFLFSCQQVSDNSKDVVSGPKRQEPKTISYQVENAKQWLSTHPNDSTHHTIAYAVNRTDKQNFAEMDSIIVPTDLTGDLVYYLPFPLEVPYLKDINKIIYFSYNTQTFATYENGIIMRSGPTNMGRQKDMTPTGLFYTNWKAEETISTFNDEWELRWNFNVLNKEGIGWHQYSLPGYPASHSCLRLQEMDAQYLFNWADQWELSENDSILTKGTPVIVFGTYDFNAPKPWMQLISNPHALDISPEELEKETTTFLAGILTEQQNREMSKVAKQ
jgi:L,D-transpeptidase catalytic domain